MRVDGLLEFCLVLGNDQPTSIATADKTFLFLAFISLIDPVPTRALLAEELLAGLAEVPDIFEIEH